MDEKISFRPLRRTKNGIPEKAAKALLLKEKRGIFAVNGDFGYPFAIPVDYFYDCEQNKIYFHGAKSGHKVDSLRKNDKVCFTVFGNEHYGDDWAPYVQSAVVFGRCRLVTDPVETEQRVRELAKRYFPTAEEIEKEISRSLQAVQLYEITIEHLCGKQVHER